MQILIRAGLCFLVCVVFSPANGTQCPDGTRNNYKGECVSVIPTGEDTQSQQQGIQRWSEPATDSGVVQGVGSEDDIEEVVGGDGAGSVEIVEEVVGGDGAGSVEIVEEAIAAGENKLLTAAAEESPGGASDAADLANALSTIQQLRKEIKDLLNRVELQRYEVEKLRGRQRDLYDDLDQRLRKQERLALTVPTPTTPSVDSIVITPEPISPAEPTPMVTNTELPSPSAESSTQVVTEFAAMNETQDEEESLVAAAAETAVSEPAPMVVGTESSSSRADSGAVLVVQPQLQVETQDEEESLVAAAAESAVTAHEPVPMMTGVDLPVPNANAGAAVIAQPQTQVDALESEELAGPVIVEQMNNGAVTQTATAVVSPRKIEVGEIAVEIEIPIELEAHENQSDAEQGPNVEDQMAAVVPADLPAKEQTTVVITATVPTTVTLDEQDAYDEAFNMLKQSRYEEAAEEFANFLRKYRNSQLTDDAWYWMAEAHYVTRDFEKALISFNTVVSYFANSPRIPASRLKIGYIQYEKADYEGSRETLAQLLRDFPAHRVAVSAQARLKKMDRDRQ